jgi:DNA replication ATP-dependent helicase Dna2
VLTPSTAQPPAPPPGTSLGDFIARLSTLVIEDSVATKRAISQVWARPLAERVAAGRAIADVRVDKVGPDGLITLRCPRNESRFREGDILCLSRGDPLSDPAFLVTLELDEETELLVSSESHGVLAFDLFAQPSGWTLDEGYLDLVTNITVAALEEAADSATGRERVLPLLTGAIRPQIDSERYDHAIARAQAWGLNAQQAEALAEAYASDIAYLIQGPPGTGKTLVLARLAQLLAEGGERVLITAFTHRAINNALNKLADLALRHDATPTTAVKIGRQASSDDLRVERFETFSASPLPDLSGAYIVGATPFATRTSRLRGVSFDTVIFDEASQITLPLAIMGMLAGRRSIFVGDHRQLPPVLATRHGDDVLRASVFASLMDRGFDTMLETTYRLSAELAAWPSAQFYESRLTPSPEAALRRMDYPHPPARHAEILDPERPKVFVDLGHRNATTRSDAEAGLAAELIAELIACGVEPSEIGVVTPYRAQARAIRSRLRAALPDDYEHRRAVVVDTVERMQGQERDLLIVSLTSSDVAFASELAEFIFQPERLNVAITRPRRKLIILGSRHLLDARPRDAAQQDAVALLRDLLADATPALPHRPMSLSLSERREISHQDASGSLSPAQGEGDEG